MTDRLTNKATELKGKAKAGIGKATDDHQLRAEGKADQVKAKTERVATDVRNAARNAKDAVKEAMDK
jgi:uncharacterized protein YjbJ (UPF0337 family)